MGFLSLLVVASMPVVEVLLIGLLGAYLAAGRCNILTPTARADINRVVYAVFTPALMLASLARTVTLPDAISWWFMPVNIGIIFLIGGVLGWVAVLILKPPQHLRGLVVASCSAANFGNLLLIVIPAVCEEDGNPFGSAKSICTDRGLSYASFSMAIGGFYIWTHTYGVMKRSSEIYCRMKKQASITAAASSCEVDPKDSARSEDDQEPCRNDDEEGVILQSANSVHEKEQHQTLLLPLLSSYHLKSGRISNTNMWEKLKQGTHQIVEELTAPPTVGAVLGLIVGAVPWLKSAFVGNNAPLRVVDDSLKLLGNGTIPCVTLVLGGNLTKGARRSTVSPAVVAAIICVRYVILPIVGVVVVRAAREIGLLPPDPLYQYVLMIQFALPPAMSIGTMSQLYDVGQEECSVIFLWTYIVAALALTIWSSIFMSIL